MHFKLVSVMLCLTVIAVTDKISAQTSDKISSQIENTENGDVFLIQKVMIDAPLAKCWAAYTTTQGWQNWVAPVAQVELEIGGTIKTNYRPEGSVDDDDTVVLKVVNYVPERILTLQANVTENFPEIMKADAERLFNVIEFERIDDEQTRVTSYGIGYKDTPEYQRLLKFFVTANEGTYEKLIAYVERGESAFKK